MVVGRVWMIIIIIIKRKNQLFTKKREKSKDDDYIVVVGFIGDHREWYRDQQQQRPRPHQREHKRP